VVFSNFNVVSLIDFNNKQTLIASHTKMMLQHFLTICSGTCCFKLAQEILSYYALSILLVEKKSVRMKLGRKEVDTGLNQSDLLESAQISSNVCLFSGKGEKNK
jgi:hypothetical protein